VGRAGQGAQPIQLRQRVVDAPRLRFQPGAVRRVSGNVVDTEIQGLDIGAPPLTAMPSTLTPTSKQRGF